MFKTCRRLPSAPLLALALLLSAAASARAQDYETKAAEATQAVQTKAVQTTAQATTQDAQAGGGQQPAPSPSPTPQTNRPAPLTGEQKVKRAFHGAFLSPAPYAIAAFNGGIRQIGEDRLPHKDTEDELADWGSASARIFATHITYRIFGNGFYPALFRQDPRYERSKSKKFGSRLGHAVSRVFVTRDDDWNLEPNYSRFAGAMTASAMTNVWERSTPGHDRIGTDATLKRFGMTFVSGAIGNLFREFGGDIFR